MASSTAWSFHHFKKEQQPLLYLTSWTWLKHVFKITYEHEADLITRSRFGVGLIQCPRGLFQYGCMGTNADRSAVLSVRQGMSFLLIHTPSSSFPPSFVIIFLSLAPFFCHTHTHARAQWLRDGPCLSISLQWSSYKDGVWRVGPAADAAVDRSFICSLQTVLNSH